MKKFISLIISIALFTAILPMNVMYAASTFTTSNGSVIIEAENTSWDSSSVSGFSKSSDSNASGGYYLRPVTYSAQSEAESSKMNFTITANEAGRYSLWVRASSGSDDGSAFWFKYNNVEWARKELSSASNNTYTWVKLLGGYPMAKNATVRFDFAPKNTDSHIDCFIFTDEPTFTPSGKVTAVTSSTLSTSTYGAPTITPIATHPRVMFNSNELTTIRKNYTASQNSNGKNSFEGLLSENFSGTLTFTNAVTTNWNIHTEYLIEANAFEYALHGTTANGQKAVTELINYLDTVTFDPNEGDVTRKMGTTIFHAAEVYDWCYNLLSTAQKEEIINQCEAIATGMEVGYPPSSLSNVTGHAGEPNIFRDLLAFGIAVYNERPDIYNFVMGRIENKMVPARDDFYQSGSAYQGTSYGYYRLYWELYAYQLTLAATNGKTKLFADGIKDVVYNYLYARRPDGQLFVQGDDSGVSNPLYNLTSFRTAKMAADLFDNADFKDEYFKIRGNEKFGSSYCNDYYCFNAVRSLIMNKPDTPWSIGRSKLPLSRYFGSPNGMILAKTSWDYVSANGVDVDMSGNNTVAAMMKIGERYGANHDHLDAGSFQLYYRGLLASDSGMYGTYGDSFDTNYAKRTIAHNALTIYDSSEQFDILGTGTSNDGGQQYQSEPIDLAAWNTVLYNRATVLDREIAPDNSYSYIKGNITGAYSSNKAQKVLRSMSFIPTDDAAYPAIMVVYDNVVSKTASQIKKFLLHTQVEPTINGSTITAVNDKVIFYGSGGSSGKIYNHGKLTVNTLLPKNASITKIGGSGHEYEVNGTNYTPTESVYDLHEAGWGRVEIKAQTEGTQTKFLNVLAVSDSGETTPFTSTLIETDCGLVGAKALDKVVMFADDAARAEGELSFTIPGSEEELDITIFGVKAGRWVVGNDNGDVFTPAATSEGGTISFTGPADNYVLMQDNSLEFVDPVLEVSGTDTVMAALPQEAVDTINSGEFTLQFTPTTIATGDRCVSLFGDVKSNFAIYKVKDANELYVKLPGTLSVLTRAHVSLANVLNQVNTITFDKNSRTLNWFVGNTLKASKVYPTGTFSIDKIPFISDGSSVAFDSIKVYDIALTAEELQ